MVGATLALLTLPFDPGHVTLGRSSLDRVIRRPALALLAAVCLAAGLMSPAEARPGQVAPPWVSASSPSSITLSWLAKAGANHYRVSYATSYSGVKKSSARTRRTSGRQTSLKVSGLKAGTMYCFMVAAVGSSGTGNRSQRHCKMTMRTANHTARRTAGIVTFNLCARAAGCHRWDPRLPAIMQRIDDADADLVALQEASGRVDELAAHLEPRGFALASASGSEALFYRTSRFSLSQKAAPSTGPDEEPDELAPVAGTWTLSESGTAAWALLKETKTRHAIVVGSVHLKNGKNEKASALRRIETRRLVAKSRFVARENGLPRSRVILAGDFNSTRSRTTDTPRWELEKFGWHDAYDRSASYTQPYLNSYNGWETTPRRSVRYGDHVDRVFLADAVGSTKWRVVVKVANGKYVNPIASDHSPVRVTLYLP